MSIMKLINKHTEIPTGATQALRCDSAFKSIEVDKSAMTSNSQYIYNNNG